MAHTSFIGFVHYETVAEDLNRGITDESLTKDTDFQADKYIQTSKVLSSSCPSLNLEKE